MTTASTTLLTCYRDAANFKKWASTVFPGAITDEQRALILGALDQGEYLIPEQVGLPNPRGDFESHYDDLDHYWNEVAEITVGTDRPTTTEPIGEFAERFRDLTWDEPAAQALLDQWMSDTPVGR